MKNLLATVICVLTCMCANAQTADLLGSWDIIEFGMVSDENSNITEEKQLRESGSVWSLFFMEAGKFKQTSNMRTGTTESHEGTWSILGDNLTLDLKVGEQQIKIQYAFELTGDVLDLNRSNPMGTMKIVTKFRKQ